MSRILPWLLLALALPPAVSASPPDSDLEHAREQLLDRIESLQQATAGVDAYLNARQRGKLQQANRALEAARLDIVAFDAHDAEQPEPPTDSIVLVEPDPPSQCDFISPAISITLFTIYAVLEEAQAAAKWACLESVAGENTAALCAPLEVALVISEFLYLDSTICLATQRAANQEAAFENKVGVAEHLNEYVDAEISSLASQESLDSLQETITQELQDLQSLATSLASDFSDLGADFNQASNSIATLTSNTLDMTTDSQNIRFKALVTQAEAEEIDDLAADTQQQMQSIRTQTLQINASVQSLNNLLTQLNTAAELKIEREQDATLGRALADPDFNVVRYKLPASMNGELERSREVLVRAVLAYGSIGVDTTNASQYLATGDSHFNAGRYLAAYDNFATAYQLLLEQSGAGLKER